MIDTHCHISREDYNDIEKVILENREEGIEKVIASGCSKENIEEVIELSLKYDDLYLTLGYHPEYADIIEDSDIDKLINYLKNTEKIVGLGEIGLDYHYGKENKNKQIELFERQLKIAEELDLPVVIHSRDAVNDTIETLKKYKVMGVIHCFSGSIETAKLYVKMGYKLGIGGVVTFKNSKLSDVVGELSLDDIVLETDSPYLAPEPFRGRQNSSKYLKYIAKAVADVKGVDIKEVENITTKNANLLFKF